jgi:hypothetical protein
MYSLAQAAKATDKSKPTIARAVKAGRSVASRAPARGTREGDGQFAKQVAAAGEQILLHQVRDTARRQRLRRGLAQRLAEPGHGAIEVMQSQRVAALDPIIGVPFLRCPVRA